MATFGKVSNTATSFKPANFDDGRHLLELMALEDTDHEKYGAGLKWVWRLASYPDNEQVVDDRGFPFEFWEFSGQGLGIDRKTGGPTKARRNVQALIGRVLDEGEDAPDADELIGRKAIGMVIMRPEDDKLEIKKLEPNKKKAAAKVVEEDEDE